jgi:hypothetical protein
MEIKAATLPAAIAVALLTKALQRRSGPEGRFDLRVSAVRLACARSRLWNEPPCVHHMSNIVHRRA